MLSDTDIRELIARPSEKGIRPLVVGNYAEESLTPVGYDTRAGPQAILFRRGQPHAIVDVDRTGSVTIRPGERAFVETLESFAIPADVAGIVVARVSFARQGILTAPTSVDPGWGYEEGFREGMALGISLYNASGRPFVLKYATPMCTLCLFEMRSPASRPAGRERIRQVEWETAEREISGHRIRRVGLRRIIASPFVVLLASIAVVIGFAYAIDVLPLSEGWKKALEPAVRLVATIVAAYSFVSRRAAERS